MALYAYQAYTREGRRVKGQVDASSLDAAKEQLSRKNLLPTSIALAVQAPSGFSFKQLLERPVSAREKILFTKQLSVLLKAGVPLLQSLELLSEQFDGRMRRMIVALKDGVKEGSSLAEGLSHYPHIFETLYVQLVRAGEASGKLELILDRLTAHLTRRDDLRRRVKSALRMPVIQMAVIGVVTMLLMTLVVPRMAAVFLKQGVELPRQTRILLATSDFLTAHYLIMGAILLGLFVAYRAYVATESGRYVIDKIKLRIPLVGFFTRTNTIVQFSGTLGMLLEAGVNLSSAFDIVCNIVDNRVLTNTLRAARDKIIKEGKITQYLKQTEIFPPLAIYLIRTGEESGKLDEMLTNVSEIYEKELRELADGLSSSLGPILLIFMSVVVGFIVLSIVQPLMGMAGTAMKKVSSIGG